MDKIKNIKTVYKCNVCNVCKDTRIMKYKPIEYAMWATLA